MSQPLRRCGVVDGDQKRILGADDTKFQSDAPGEGRTKMPLSLPSTGMTCAA